MFDKSLYSAKEKSEDIWDLGLCLEPQNWDVALPTLYSSSLWELVQSTFLSAGTKYLKRNSFSELGPFMAHCFWENYSPSWQGRHSGRRARQVVTYALKVRQEVRLNFSQWPTSSNGDQTPKVPQSPQTSPTAEDQVLKCMSLGGTFHFSSTRVFPKWNVSGKCVCTVR